MKRATASVEKNLFIRKVVGKMKIKITTPLKTLVPQTLKDLFKPNPDLRKELDVIYKGANCTGCPSEWFFPEPYKGRVPKDSPIWLGLETCSECKVIQECYNFAKTNHCVGVWGGVLFGNEGPTRMRIRK